MRFVQSLDSVDFVCNINICIIMSDEAEREQHCSCSGSHGVEHL